MLFRERAGKFIALLVLLTVTVTVLAVPAMAQISGTNPQLYFQNTGVSITGGGLWRLRLNSSGQFVTEQNTAAAGDFSTLTEVSNYVAGSFKLDANMVPDANGTRALGSTSLRWGGSFFTGGINIGPAGSASLATSALSLAGNGVSVGIPLIELQGYSSSGDSPTQKFYRAAGAIGSPGSVANGYGITNIENWGYQAGGFRFGGALQMIVDGSPSGFQVPTMWTFSTNSGTAVSERFRVNHLGYVSTAVLAPVSATPLCNSSGATTSLTNAIGSCNMNFPASVPAAGFYLTSAGSGNTAFTVLPTVIPFTLTGMPPINAVYFSGPLTHAGSCPANFVGSKAEAWTSLPSGGSVVYNVQKNQVDVGTITFDTMGGVAFTTAGGTPFNYSIGDFIDIYTTNTTPDPDMAGVLITILCN